MIFSVPFFPSRGIRITFTPFIPITNTRISENEIFGHGYGILSGSVLVDDSQFTENYIHDNLIDGMRLLNLDDSEISENFVMNNGGRGIALESGSTGNKISENTATGNTGFDLFHDGTSTPNTWTDNTYGTKSGADIP